MKLALGTAQFGLAYGIANHSGQVSREVAKEMLVLAQAQQIDTLDTAIAYGESEACLGALGVKNFKLVTKLPSVPSDGKDIGAWIQGQVDGAMERLGVESLYGLLLHRPEQLLEQFGSEIFRALHGLRERGVVQKIGISIYSPDVLNEILPRYSVDLVQAPFNLIDQRILHSGWMRRLAQDGIELHTRSAFLQGLLLMHRDAIPAKFSRWAEIWDRWHNWQRDNSISALQACLAFALGFDEVERVIVGADSLEQLAQIINASKTDSNVSLPNLNCADEMLVNPARWAEL